MDNNFGSISQLRSDHNFDIDLKTHRDLTCGICRNLLNDAYRCQCDSRFCRQCIEIYLNGTVKLCPKCPMLLSTIDLGLSQDNDANKRISMIKVKCPEQFCLSYISLENVLEHLKVHQIECPYRNLGCTKPRLRHASVTNHLHNKVLDHTRLLLDSIYHLQNEVTTIKEELHLSKENIRNNEEYIKSVLSELKALKSADRKSWGEIELLKVKSDKYRRHTIKVNKKIEIMTKQLSKKTLENKIGNLDATEIGKSELITHQQTKVDPNTNLGSTDQYQEPLISPFEWKPDLAALIREEKSKAQINRYKKWFSIPFYSHISGYKICLRIDQGGLCSGFSIHFHIMKGKFDESLVWPMKLEISIGLVDSITGIGRLIKRFSYENSDGNQKANFLKPRHKMNPSCGTNIIHLKNIFHKSMHIKCVVNADK